MERNPRLSSCLVLFRQPIETCLECMKKRPKACSSKNKNPRSYLLNETQLHLLAVPDFPPERMWLCGRLFFVVSLICVFAMRQFRLRPVPSFMIWSA